MAKSMSSLAPSNTSGKPTCFGLTPTDILKIDLANCCEKRVSSSNPYATSCGDITFNLHTTAVPNKCSRSRINTATALVFNVSIWARRCFSSTSLLKVTPRFNCSLVTLLVSTFIERSIACKCHQPSTLPSFIFCLNALNNDIFWTLYAYVTTRSLSSSILLWFNSDGAVDDMCFKANRSINLYAAPRLVVVCSSCFKRDILDRRL